MLFKRIKRDRKQWFQDKIDNNELVEGIVTKRDVMTNVRGGLFSTETNYNYYIEIDNHYRYKVKSLKEYNALPLNQPCKVLVVNEEIMYIEGYTDLNDIMRINLVTK